jgi:cardiolipin synthase
MPDRQISASGLTIPNIITLARILLTPLFIILLIQKRYGPALVLFVVACFSDLADGLIARHWEQRSPLGTVLDPLADKLLLVSSFVTLSIYRLIPSWLTVLVISRDVILVLGTVILKILDYPLVIRPTPVGKTAAACQMATVFLVLAACQWSLAPWVQKAWFVLVGLLTAVSGVQYLANGLKMGNPSREADPPGGSRG